MSVLLLRSFEPYSIYLNRAYFAFGGLLFPLTSYSAVLASLYIGPTVTWDFYTPPIIFALSYLLSAVMAFAVLIMCISHILQVARAETAVEGMDFAAYRKFARGRDEVSSLSFSKRSVSFMSVIYRYSSTRTISGQNGTLPWYSISCQT